MTARLIHAYGTEAEASLVGPLAQTTTTLPFSQSAAMPSSRTPYGVHLAELMPAAIGGGGP
jgi:hypothetical protein